MESDTKKRQVTLEQLKCLLDFLKEHPVLAKGLTRGRRGRLQTLRIWNSCAKLLNACASGAVKDGKGWSKYWCDWKYRVRRRALELRAAEENNKPPPEGITELSAMETTILNIIGHNTIDGVVIKTDPLMEETIEEDNMNTFKDLEAESNERNEPQPTPSRRRKRRQSSNNFSDLENLIGCDSPHERKPEAKCVKTNHPVDADADEEVFQFLELEKEGLGILKRNSETLHRIANELSRLTDAVSQIGNLLVNKRLNSVV